MFSITTRRSPRPKLRVTRRTRAVSAPHMSHRLIARLDPSRDDDDLSGWTDLDDAVGRGGVERFAFDDVPGFARLSIAVIASWMPNARYHPQAAQPPVGYMPKLDAERSPSFPLAALARIYSVGQADIVKDL